MLTSPKHQQKLQALWRACAEGDLATVKSVLQDPKVDVNWVGREKGDTPFHRACRFGRTDIVKTLLDHATIIPNFQNAGLGHGMSLACQEGMLETLQVVMLDPRINVNLRAKENSSSLWMATLYGHFPCVRFLLTSNTPIETTPRSDPGTLAWHNKTAAEIARLVARAKYLDETPEEFDRCIKEGPEVGLLIEEYSQDHRAVSERLRRHPEVRGLSQFRALLNLKLRVSQRGQDMNWPHNGWASA